MVLVIYKHDNMAEVKKSSLAKITSSDIKGKNLREILTDYLRYAVGENQRKPFQDLVDKYKDAKDQLITDEIIVEIDAALAAAMEGGYSVLASGGSGAVIPYGASQALTAATNAQAVVTSVTQDVDGQKRLKDNWGDELAKAKAMTIFGGYVPLAYTKLSDADKKGDKGKEILQEDKLKRELGLVTKGIRDAAMAGARTNYSEYIEKKDAALNAIRAKVTAMTQIVVAAYNSVGFSTSQSIAKAKPFAEAYKAAQEEMMSKIFPSSGKVEQVY